VTGTAEDLAEIAKRYGAFYARQPVEAAGGYVVDHSSETYVVGREGQMLSKIAHAAPPDEVAAEIRRRLK
jgi:protein SCO1/2